MYQRPYRIKYTGNCVKGSKRKINEDNVLYEKNYLDHNDNAVSFSGLVMPDGEWFAVFDGMGGHRYGEKASFLAAKTFSENISGMKTNRRDSESDIGQISFLCDSMNDAVCNCARDNKLVNLGSSVAGICFDGENIFGFNIGDSRAYRLRNGSLHQLSRDHVARSIFYGKSALTQCLGIPRNEFKLQPAAFWEESNIGDCYLLCTNGLTNSLTDAEIVGVLRQQGNLEEKKQWLYQLVLERGGADDTTLILFECMENRED